MSCPGQNATSETLVEAGDAETGIAVCGDGREMTRARPSGMADDRALGTQIAHRNLLRADESCGVVDPPQGDVDVWSEKQGAVLAEPGRYEAGVKRRQLGHRPIRRMRDEYPRDVLVSAAFDGGDDRRDQRGGEVVGQPIRCARDRERTRVADVVDEMAVDRVVVPAVGQRRCGVGDRDRWARRLELSRQHGRWESEDANRLNGDTFGNDCSVRQVA